MYMFVNKLLFKPVRGAQVHGWLPGRRFPAQRQQQLRCHGVAIRSFSPLACAINHNITDHVRSQAIRNISKLAQARYPGVLFASYNIMMVGTASSVWREHPDWVSFDRFGVPVVDTHTMRLSLDLASPAAREYYADNILATVRDMDEQGVYLDFGVVSSSIDRFCCLASVALL